MLISGLKGLEKLPNWMNRDIKFKKIEPAVSGKIV